MLRHAKKGFKKAITYLHAGIPFLWPNRVPIKKKKYIYDTNISTYSYVLYVAMIVMIIKYNHYSWSNKTNRTE